MLMTPMTPQETNFSRHKQKTSSVATFQLLPEIPNRFTPLITTNNSSVHLQFTVQFKKSCRRLRTRPLNTFCTIRNWRVIQAKDACTIQCDASSTGRDLQTTCTQLQRILVTAHVTLQKRQRRGTSSFSLSVKSFSSSPSTFSVL